MKKLCSMILVLSLLLSMTNVFAASENDLNSAIFEVTSLGIFEGDENGNLNIDKTMTRAEFAKIIVVLSGMKDMAGAASSDPAPDVPASHWASGYIKYLLDSGLMKGFEDGTFRPDDKVTLEQCVKTILVVMGFEVVAEGMGGYPDGYTALAVKKHMLDGVNGKGSEDALRRDIILVIYNSLDVPNLVRSFSENAEYREDSKTTLRNTILKLDDLDSVTGVITATQETWLNAPNSSMEDGQIEIDGLLYDVAPSIIDVAAGYIGQKVVAYYKYDGTMSYPLIHNIQPTVLNEVTVINAEDVLSFSSNGIKYETENGKKKEIDINSETSLIYNDRPMVRFTQEYGNIARGRYVVINNDYDSTPEYVFAYEYKNYVVEKTNTNGSIKLKYIDEYEGSVTVLHRNLLLDFDKENAFIIKDSEGKEISFDSLTKDSVVSVYENKNDSFIKIVLSLNDSFVSTISSKESDDYRVYIDDEDYIMDSSAIFNWTKMGEYYTFYLDAYGNIAYIEETTEDSAWKFGYIFRAGKEGLGRQEVVLLDAGKVINRAEQNLEDRTDTSSIPVTLCQNNDVLTLQVADKVSADGKSIAAADIGEFAGQPVRYALNEDGQLKRIESLEEIGGSVATKYNAKEKVFGTVNVLEQRPFMIDSDTKVICLPKNDGAGEEDLLVQISIDNKDINMQYNAFGYEQDEETNAAKLLVITQEMRADKIKQVVPSQAKVALIGNVKHTFDADDTEYLKITLVTGNEVKTMDSLPIDERPAIANLKAGDYAFYYEDANGKLDNVKIVNNVRKAMQGEEGTSSSEYSQSIGYVGEIRMNLVDNVQRIRINQIDLITLDGLDIINVPVSNYPDVYIYDLETDTVSSGTIDDIVPYPVPVSNPEKVVVLYSGETIRSIIIMR